MPAPAHSPSTRRAATPPSPGDPGAPGAPRPPGPLKRSALLVLCACVLVAQGMVAAINLLLPQLSASGLDLSASELLWTVDAYVIVFAGLLIPAGALGDRYGRKGALLAGIGLFAAGAAVSALAGSAALLIAGRGVSGAGAALIMPATMSILMRVAPPEQRPRALASWTLAVGLGGFAGNAGGGLVGEYLSWRALFWVMVPLAAVLALAAARAVPRTDHSAGTPAAPALDPVGTLLLTAGLVAVLFGIIESPMHGWASARILGAFAAGAVLLALFTAHALRSPAPLVDPRVFRSARLRAATLGTAAGFFGLFALFYVNSQYLQYVQGYGAARAGFAILPLTVGMALVPRFAARWAASPRPVAGGGLLLVGAGLLATSTVGAGTPYAVYACWLLVISAGTGLCMPALTMSVVSALPPRQAGLGSGLGTSAREIGAALGVAVTGTVLADHTGTGHAGGAADFTSGMAAALRVVGIVVIVAAAVVWAGFSGRDRGGEKIPV
ncbi:MFS transporter [Streptomyces sp. p1417]|uniref:MFS transporter n=1 Tax=Streptomyces typhae TaxID=2681492 RepID=A0A6L6WUJ1_9ACTN|nr:MFS transporter [Streptomyces typhae]